MTHQRFFVFDPSASTDISLDDEPPRAEIPTGTYQLTVTGPGVVETAKITVR